MYLKDLGIRMSQVKFGRFNRTFKLDMQLAFPRPQEPTDKNKSLTPRPMLKIVCLTVKNHHQSWHSKQIFSIHQTISVSQSSTGNK